MDHNSTLLRGEYIPQLSDHILRYYDESPFNVTDIQDGDIIYCDTHRLNDYKHILLTKRDLVLITHNSDASLVDGVKLRYDSVNTDEYDGCYRMWFSQNSYSVKDNVIPLPIGFENMKWDVTGDKQRTFNTIVTNPPIHDVYLNCGDINNNRSHRLDCYNKCSDIPVVTIDQPTFGFYDYMKRMSEFKFIISPYGNGIDCHRTWEILHLGRIPIMLNGPLNRLYGDLPVLFVDDWCDIGGIDLDYQYNKLMSLYNNDILKQQHWNNLITGVI